MKPSKLTSTDVADRHADEAADGVGLRGARRRCALAALILSPSQHVSRGMLSIVALCSFGLTPTRCSASPRAPPTPGRSSLPTSSDEERRRSGRPRPIGVAGVRELLDAQVRRAGRERHLVAGEPRRAERRDAERDDDARRAALASSARFTRCFAGASLCGERLHDTAPVPACATADVVRRAGRTLDAHPVRGDDPACPASSAKVSSVRRLILSVPLPLTSTPNVAATSTTLPVWSARPSRRTFVAVRLSPA